MFTYRIYFTTRMYQDGNRREWIRVCHPREYLGIMDISGKRRRVNKVKEVKHRWKQREMWTVFKPLVVGSNPSCWTIFAKGHQKALEVKIELSGSKPSQLERPIIEKGQFSKKGSLTGTPATVSVKRYFSRYSDFFCRKKSLKRL